MIEVILYRPEIPPNTGNIGRSCVVNGLRLHLVGPLGFSLADKHLRRSGLDYWSQLDVHLHEDWGGLESSLGPERRLWLFSSKAGTSLWEAKFRAGDCLVFGPETSGLPDNLRARYPDSCLRIPMIAGGRSLNLSSSAAVGIYEALRQIHAG